MHTPSENSPAMKLTPTNLNEHLRLVAEYLAASCSPHEDSKLEIAYAISRHLGLGWPSSALTATKEQKK